MAILVGIHIPPGSLPVTHARAGGAESEGAAPKASLFRPILVVGVTGKKLLWNSGNHVGLSENSVPPKPNGFADHYPY